MKSRIFTSVRAAVVALACVASLAPKASADTNGWIPNASGVWSGANWSNAPIDNAAYATNVLVFTGTTNYFSTNDFISGGSIPSPLPFQLNGILFNNSGAATNANAVNLSGNALAFIQFGVGTNAGITNSGVSLVNIANNLDINGTGNLNLAGNGGVVTISGNITGTGGLIKLGTHTNILTGNNDFSGNTLVQAGLLRGLVTSNNSTVFGTGGLSVQGGSLEFRGDISNATVGAGSGYNVTQNSNFTGTIIVDRQTVGFSNIIYRMNNLSVSNGTIGVTANNGASAGLMFDGATTVGGTAAVFNVTAGNLSINGSLTELNAGTALRKTGAGTLLFTNGASIAYSGVTALDAGNVQVLVNVANNALLPTVPTPGMLYIRGGTLQMRITNDIVAGPGAGYDFLVTGNGGGLNVDRPTGSTLGTNMVTVHNITFTSNNIGLGVANTANVATNLTFSTGNADQIKVAGTVTIATNTLLTVNGDTILNGAVGESILASYIRKNGTGRLFVTNGAAVSNTYSGGTILGQGFLQVAATVANPAPLGQGDITLQGGVLEVRANTNLAFGPGANGYNLTVSSNGAAITLDRISVGNGTNNFVTFNNLTFVTNSAGITNALFNSSNLIFAAANGFTPKIAGTTTIITNTLITTTNNVAFEGVIADGGSGFSLRKAGAGRMFITNSATTSNTYSGGTIVDAGQLQAFAPVNNPAPLGNGDITLRGGTLEIRTTNAATTSQIFGPGAGYMITGLTNTSTINIDRLSGTNTAAIVDVKGLALGTAGNLVNTAGNAYQLRAGTLAINGTGATLTVSNDLILTGAITDSGNGFTKGGAGRLFFSNGVDQTGLTGDFRISAGAVQVIATTNNSQALGVGTQTLNGGTLELRADTNLTFGAGTGYNIGVTNGGGTISVDRITTNAANNTLFVNSINFLTNTGSLTMANGNGFMLMVNSNITGPGFIIDNGANNLISNNVINITGVPALAFTNSFVFNGSNQIAGIRFSNTAIFGGAATTDHILNVTNGGTLQFVGGPVSATNDGVNAITSFTKAGAGTLTFSNQVVFNPVTAVTNTGGGALQFFGTNNQFGSVTQNGPSVTLANAGSTNNNTPLGTGPIIINGGTLQYRADNPAFTNITIGAGIGYTNIVNSNATISVDRTFTAGANQTISVGGLSLNGVRLTVTNANGFRFANNGTTTISNKVFLDTKTLVTLNGQLVESAPGSVLVKEGVSNLVYGSTLSALHSGGTIITNGSQVRWQAVNLAPTNGGVPAVYQFGSGAITLDGASLFAFQANTSSNFTFSTPFVIGNKVQAAAGQFNGDAGGTIEFSRNGAGSPVITNTGAVSLMGTLRIAGTPATGSVTPGFIKGTTTIMGDNREITVATRFADGNGRVVINGDITGDGTYSNLVIRVNNGSAIELSGNNSGVGSMDLAQSYQGQNGRVRFTTNAAGVLTALPSGAVVVESGVLAALNFPLANFNAGTNGTYSLPSNFQFRPNSIIALEGNKTRATNTLDLSPSGLNADVFIGVAEGAGYNLTNGIIPFANQYKIGGGAGTTATTLALSGTNQLTGVGNSLIVNPNPYDAQVANQFSSGTLINIAAANASNTYGGGTMIYQGTLQINSGRTNTPLGTGAIDNYGTLNVVAATSSLAGPDGLTNNNVLRMQPGSTLQLGATGVFTGGAASNRFGDSADLTLNAARLTFTGLTNVNGIANAITNTETIGNLNYGLGSRLNISAQAASNLNSTFLTVNSLTRTNMGTLQLLRNASATNDTSFGGSTRVIASVAPTVNNGMIAPQIINETDNSFVTYDSSTARGAVVGITNATYTSSSLATSTATDIVDMINQPTNITILASPVTANAIRTLTNAIRGAQDVTITSGGLITGGVNHDSRFIFGSTGSPVEGAIYVSAGTATFSNDFVAAGITKFGAGTMTLTNGRSYSNGWNVNWGTLTVGNSNGLGTAAAGNYVNLNNGQNTVALTFNQNANNVIYTSGAITNYDFNIINLAPQAADRNQTFGGQGLTLNTINGGPQGSVLRVTMNQDRTRGVLAGNLNVMAPSTLDIQSTVGGRVSGTTNRLEVAGNLVGNAQSLNKIGIGALGLLSDNTGTWIGGRITNKYGALHVGNNGSLGDATSSATINSNAVLEIDAATVNYASIAPVTQNAGSAERWLGGFNRFNNNTNSETFTVAGGLNLQVSADMSAVTNKTIRLAAGAGLEGYQFSDDARGTTINLGRSMSVDLAGNAKIGQSGVDTGRAGVLFNVASPITESSVGSSLSKIGTDAVNLSGNSTYTGGTRVMAGTLLVNNGFQSILTTNQYGPQVSAANATNGSATGLGAVTVASQAMLGGTNGAIAGPVTLQTGGTLMPGNLGTVSSILIQSNLSFQIGSIFDVDIASTTSADSVIVKGDVDAGGATLNIRLSAAIPSIFTNAIVLINNMGTNSIAGGFAGFNNGDTVVFNGGDSTNAFSGTFLYHFNDPALVGYENDLVLTAVPEPGTAALMVIGAALCGLHVMRRRKS